jgi:hypothetical protein
VCRFDSSVAPLRRHIIHGIKETGFAGMGADASKGSWSLAAAATVLSTAVTFDGSGGLITAVGKSSGCDEHANRTRQSVNFDNLNCFFPRCPRSSIDETAIPPAPHARNTPVSEGLALSDHARGLNFVTLVSRRSFRLRRRYRRITSSCDGDRFSGFLQIDRLNSFDQ